MDSYSDTSSLDKKSELTCSLYDVTFSKKFNRNRHKVTRQKTSLKSQDSIKTEKDSLVDSSTFSKESNLTCSLCHVTFSKKFNLNRHKESCQKTYLNCQGSSGRNFNSDSSTLTEESGLICSLCNVTFSKKFSVKRHKMLCQNSSFGLQCSYSGCSLRFRFKEQLIQHIQTVHDNSIALPQKLQFASLSEFHCWKDQEELTTSAHYTQKKGKDKNTVYHCQVNSQIDCISMIVVKFVKTEDKELIDVTYYSSHSHGDQSDIELFCAQTKSDSEDFQCPNCNMKFTRKFAVKCHLKMCIKGKVSTAQRKCSLCSLKFRFRTSLITHLKNAHKKNISPPIKKQFHDREEFGDWKRKQEERTHSYFTKQTGKKRGRTEIFYCQQDGSARTHETPVRKTGRTRKKGRVKTGAMCLAMIKVKEKDDGTLTVEYYPSHCHEFNIDDVKHHRRPPHEASPVNQELVEVPMECVTEMWETDSIEIMAGVFNISEVLVITSNSEAVEVVGERKNSNVN